MGVVAEVNLRYCSFDTVYLVFETGQSLTKQTGQPANSRDPSTGD